MLAVRKADPQQGKVKIQYIPRVEAVTYPSFAQAVLEQLSMQPHTSDPENYSHRLAAACNAKYVAEGSIRFPALDEQSYPLVFSTSEPLRPEWYLTLGEGATRISGAAHGVVIKEFLQRVNLGQPRRRGGLAVVIAENIECHFLHDHQSPLPQSHDYRLPPPQSKALYIQSMIEEIAVLVKADYLPILEESFKNDPKKPIMPQKYNYSITSAGPVDPGKLVRL